MQPSPHTLHDVLQHMPAHYGGMKIRDENIKDAMRHGYRQHDSQYIRVLAQGDKQQAACSQSLCVTGRNDLALC